MDFHVDIGNLQFSIYSKPVLSEQHIGVDQGVKNFAIAVVQQTVGNSLVVVHVKNHTDLELKKYFKAADVLCGLKQHTRTDLLLWIN